VDRRHLLKGGMAGMLTLWASPLLHAARQTNAGVRKLTNTLSVLDGGGSNVVAFSSADGVLLVDTGAPTSADRVMTALKELGGNAKVHTVFNTHYHLAQTGNNEAFVAAGVKIVPRDRTR